jgi:hypothetical protein
MMASAALVCLVLLHPILRERVMPDIEGYLERKAYYEKVISKKGLSFHKGLYWKEKR